MASTKFYNLSQFLKVIEKLEVKNSADYNHKQKNDPKLPARPHREYPDWSGWKSFREKSDNFYSYLQAKKAVKNLGITTSYQYRHNRLEDLRLPPIPQNLYSKDWSGWADFLDTKRTRRSKKSVFYPDIKQAMIAVQKLGITSSNQYLTDYKQDSRLPTNPKLVYATEWINWNVFFGKITSPDPIPQQYYSSLQYARVAARSLGITSSLEYKKKHILNPKLPPKPDEIYSSKWKGWDHFCSLPNPRNSNTKYKTLKAATKGARKLEAANARDYLKKYKADPQLPSNPSVHYANWISWENYLGTKTCGKYKTLQLASAATRKLGITSAREYTEKYNLDPKLPSNPYSFYQGWAGWVQFLKKP